MNTTVMFSSATDLWETPISFFKELDQEFHFTLDVCAVSENAKCSEFFRLNRTDWPKSGQASAGVTRRMGDRSGTGQKKRQRRPVRWLCCFRPERTRHGFTNISMEPPKFDSLEAA